MAWDVEEIRLADEEYFETLNGLWAGKKPPFVHAGVIRNTNFAGLGTVDFSNVAWLNVEAKQIAKRQLKRGDIIIERSGGGPKQPVGRVVFFNRSDGLFSFSNFTSAVRVRRMDVFDPKFIFYSLSELYQSGRTEDIQRRTTGIRNLDFGAYKERATIPVIPLCEQRKIAAVLGLVQRAIEQQERLVALTGELKRTLMHKLFTEGLRGEPQKQTEIGPVPESWDAIRIDGIGKLVTGATPKTSIGEYYSPEEIDFITPADLSKTRKIYSSERKISRCGLESIRGLPSDAILCVCIGSSIGKVGMTSKTESATNQQINAIICKDSYNPAFVYYLLDYHATYWRGFATFGPVPILSKSRFGSIRIAVPPDREEQDEIANRLTTLDNSIEIYSRRKDLLNDLFRTLLHQLMTALIRVNDLDLSEIEAAVGEA